MGLDPVKFISEVNFALTHSKDAWANIRASLDAARMQLGPISVFLFVLNAETNRLTLASASALDAGEFRKLEQKGGHEMFLEVIQSGEPLSTPLNGEFQFMSRGSDTAILRLSPVKISGQNEGILGSVFEHGLPPDSEIEGLIDLVASLIGQALRIERAVRGERERLIEENSHLKQELREKHGFSHIVGTSNPMRQVYDQVTQVARSNATVLLRGESGTGKEMIANAIHYNSLRSKRPFVKINCAALPDTLIESELFGHEKGAFTGAERFKKGRFDLAEGGTLFLDEIGDLPVQTQIKLLRVLQEREFERLGGTETIKTNIRLITATNKNLEEAISAGKFREDLYYRLNVFTIFLPPLRERKPDILLLAEHFLEKYEKEHGKRIRRISTPAIDMLMSYHFPGNVRELENAIERAVLVCDSNVIHGHHLPPTLQTAEVSGTVTALSLASAVEAFERDLIQDTLKSTGGNIAKAARQLDSTERILGYKIKKYGIDAVRFRR